jgi:predicted GNAT superfamily acetyltransferase
MRPGAIVLSPGPDGFPVSAAGRAETLLVSIPDDIVGLRSSAPDQADAWREAVRETLSSALADGYRGEAITRDGWLLLSR